MNGAWHSVQIGGKPADIYEPAGTTRPRFGVLYLHGSRGDTLVDRPAFTRLFDQLKLACICPHGGRCWWGDRVCAEFDPQISPETYLLNSVLPFFRERWQLASHTIGITGAGMGGQGALKLAFKHPSIFPAVAVIAAAIDYHEIYGQGTSLDDLYNSKEQARQDTALMHIHPSQFPPHVFFCIDPDDMKWYRGNDRLHEKLNALGVPHEVDFTTRAGSHSWDYYNHMADRAVRFLHAGLEQESRRLL
jgi:poly(3-hydroxybutyrate) depolymerase